MKAIEAKALSEKRLNGKAIASYLNGVHARIRESAMKGQFSIVHPLQGFSPYPNERVKEAIWEALRSDGYKVNTTRTPTPGHPASGPYTEISWYL